MSFQAMALAVKTKIGNPVGKSIFVMLANYCDHNNECFPSQATIANDCECSVRTVGTWLDKFERAGLIKRQKRQRGDGSRTSDYITIIQHAGGAGRIKSNMQELQGQHAGAADHEPITEPITKKTIQKDLTEGFDAFWEAYGKKTGKKETLALWRRNKLSKYAGEINRAAALYARHRVDRKYQKDPVRWLRGEHWLDDMQTTRTKPYLPLG